MIDLENLKGLASFATPGPWLVWDDGDVGTAYPVTKVRQRRRDRFGVEHEPVEIVVESDHIANTSPEDGEYVAAVNPTVVLEMIAEIERLRAALAEKSK